MRYILYILLGIFLFASPGFSQKNLLGDAELTAGTNGIFNGSAAMVYKLSGRRTTFNNTTAWHDVVPFEADSTSIPVLTSSDSLVIVSSSDSDGTGGTGLRTVSVVYIDTNYVMQEATVTLNGTTPVGIPFKALDVLWVEGITAGSSGYSVGNIILRVNSGVDVAQIVAGKNKSQSATFTVPDNYTAYLYRWGSQAIAQAIDFRLEAQTETKDKTITTIYLEQDNCYLPSNTSDERDLPYIAVPERAKIKISAKAATTTNAIADVSLWLVLRKNND